MVKHILAKRVDREDVKKTKCNEICLHWAPFSSPLWLPLSNSDFCVNFLCHPARFNRESFYISHKRFHSISLIYSFYWCSFLLFVSGRSSGCSKCVNRHAVNVWKSGCWENYLWSNAAQRTLMDLRDCIFDAQQTATAPWWELVECWSNCNETHSHASFPVLPPPATNCCIFCW